MVPLDRKLRYTQQLRLLGSGKIFTTGIVVVEDAGGTTPRSRGACGWHAAQGSKAKPSPAAGAQLRARGPGASAPRGPLLRAQAQHSCQSIPDLAHHFSVTTFISTSNAHPAKVASWHLVIGAGIGRVPTRATCMSALQSRKGHQGC